MCGRIFQTLPLDRLLKIARASRSLNSQLHNTSFNVCPTTYIPAIRASKLYVDDPTVQQEDSSLDDAENREVHFMKWGHKSKNNFVINGRIEEMLSKRMFIDFMSNRCVVILEGYYQWNEKKEPFSFKPKEGDHFLAAALYTDENEVIILTKDATPQLREVHSRMPVMLSPEEVSLWLNPKYTTDLRNIIFNSILNKDKPLWKNVGFAKLAPYVNTIKDKSSKCLMTAADGLMKYWGPKKKVETVDAQGQTIEKASKALIEKQLPAQRIKMDLGSIQEKGQDSKPSEGKDHLEFLEEAEKNEEEEK